MREIYLDNAATTLPDHAAAEAMLAAVGAAYGNPSSLHAKGLEAERVVRAAREAVARLAGVPASGIVFTSGGTEANNLAIRGVLSVRSGGVLTTAVEHSSVLEPAERAAREGRAVTVVPVDRRGVVDPDAVRAGLRQDVALLSVMAVNNEAGTVQPLAEIGRALGEVRGRRPLFHVDAVQAAGKIPMRVREWGADLVTLSAHKIHGPKGVGALWIRNGVRLAPLFGGGDQERGLRPGTENVPGIAGFGAAAEVAARDPDGAAARMQRLRGRLRDLVLRVPDAFANGADGGAAAPHILNVTFPRVRGETLVHRLEMDGIYVSTGSACHSRLARPSHVLVAMGLPVEAAMSSIRFSLSRLTTEEEIEIAGEAVQRAVEELRTLVR